MKSHSDNTGRGMLIVMLRRPGKDDPRRDPYYEFGSFGLTSCHSTNLLADSAATGYRLAFVQGGDLGFRLVMLTPPVDVRDYADRHEAVWSPGEMPLRYDRAPLLIDNSGSDALPELEDTLRGVARRTWEGRFSSAFRSRKRPLSASMTMAITDMWNKAIESPSARAREYWEALPTRPDLLDEDRRLSYEHLRALASGGGASSSSNCRVSSKRTRDPC